MLFKQIPDTKTPPLASLTKFLIALSTSLFAAAACHPSIPAGQYSLTGNIKGMKGDRVFMQIRSDSGFVWIDSTILHDGRFTFKGSVDEPRRITLFFRNESGKKEPICSSFYLENAEIDVRGEITNRRDILITGAKVDAISKKMQAAEAYSPRYVFLQNQFYGAGLSGPQLPADSVTRWRQEVASLESQRNERIKAAVRTYAGSYPALHAVLQHATIFTPEELKNLTIQFQQFDKSASYQKLLTALVATQTVKIGQSLSDFSMPDSAGQNHKLLSSSNKWLLVEIWASWCGPCRKQIPALKSLTTKYSDLSIVGVSIDRDVQKWKQALLQEQMPWLNLRAPSEKWAWDNFLITAIPANFLLDSHRHIVAKNISPSEIANIIETSTESHHH